MYNFKTLFHVKDFWYESGNNVPVESVEVKEIQDITVVSFINSYRERRQTLHFKNKAELVRFCLNLISCAEGTDVEETDR